jgi:hypothetical protein
MDVVEIDARMLETIKKLAHFNTEVTCARSLINTKSSFKKRARKDF